MSKQLFNPNGDDTDIKVFGGDTTNILNLTNIKYNIFITLFEKAYSNNWVIIICC